MSKEETEVYAKILGMGIYQCRYRYMIEKRSILFWNSVNDNVRFYLAKMLFSSHLELQKGADPFADSDSRDSTFIIALVCTCKAPRIWAVKRPRRLYSTIGCNPTNKVKTNSEERAGHCGLTSEWRELDSIQEKDNRQLFKRSKYCPVQKCAVRT